MSDRANRLRSAFGELLKRNLALTQKDIAEKMGASASNVSSAFGGDPRVLTNRFLSRFNAAYGNIFSLEWLLNGDGEMLKSHSIIKSQEEVIDITGDNYSHAYLVPLVPMSAMGGELVGFEDEGVRDEDCEKVISPVSGASFAVPIYGDSMEPEYPNGSRVFVKQINPSDFIAWGNAYVLDTTNGIILKIIVKSDDPNSLRCVSLNPSGRYQPFDVPKRTIRGMYRVLACVTAKG